MSIDGKKYFWPNGIVENPPAYLVLASTHMATPELISKVSYPKCTCKYILYINMCPWCQGTHKVSENKTLSRKCAFHIAMCFGHTNNLCLHCQA